MATHSACQIAADGQSYMPRRILDIGIQDDGSFDVQFRRPLRLLQSTDAIEDRRYACLSHKWAPSGRTIITTKATYDQHTIGIRFQDLGLVYQDTVHVMGRLGVRYVWIDSLCIIQDDAADWQRVSKEMAKVYGKALFTLARHTDTVGSLRVTGCQARVVNLASVSPPVYMRLSPGHFHDYGKNFVVLERGWVYQERLLSPRFVHFTNEEIIWECMEQSDCQCGMQDRLPIGRSSPYLPPKVEHATTLGFKSGSTAPDEADIRQRWRRIVEEYSQLKLTKATDRLPALQGCADQVREQLGDTYSFGLWKNSSPGDLA